MLFLSMPRADPHNNFCGLDKVTCMMKRGSAGTLVKIDSATVRKPDAESRYAAYSLSPLAVMTVVAVLYKYYTFQLVSWMLVVIPSFYR